MGNIIQVSYRLYKRKISFIYNQLINSIIILVWNFLIKTNTCEFDTTWTNYHIITELGVRLLARIIINWQNIIRNDFESSTICPKKIKRKVAYIHKSNPCIKLFLLIGDAGETHLYYKTGIIISKPWTIYCNFLLKKKEKVFD